MLSLGIRRKGEEALQPEPAKPDAPPVGGLRKTSGIGGRRGLRFLVRDAASGDAGRCGVDGGWWMVDGGVNPE